MKLILTGLTTTILISAGAALAAGIQLAQFPLPLPSGLPGLPGTQPSKDEQYNNETIRVMKLYIQALEQEMAKDPFSHKTGFSGEINTYSNFSDFRRSVLTPFKENLKAHPEYAAVKAKLYELRKPLALRGFWIGNWWEWEFDGQPITEDLKKYFQSVEDKLLRIRGDSPDSVDKALPELDTILKRPEFSSNSVLKFYKDNYVADLYAGAKWYHGYQRIKAVATRYRTLRGEFERDWKNCPAQCKDRIRKSAKDTLQEIDRVKRFGLNLKDYKIKLDEREPLSEEWDLEKVRAEVVKIQTAK